MTKTISFYSKFPTAHGRKSFEITKEFKNDNHLRNWLNVMSKKGFNLDEIQ